jgi:hydroxymethylbilane synthase
MRLATRGSALALAQARSVADRLAAVGIPVEVVAMRTEGDRLAEARLAAVGGKGLFVREIEEALLRGDVDVAVHSLKDLPAELPRGLALAAFPERADALRRSSAGRRPWHLEPAAARPRAGGPPRSARGADPRQRRHASAEARGRRL